MGWAIVQSQTCSADDSKNPLLARLSRHGFTPFNPRCRQRAQVQQLFPGYVFVSGVGDRWGVLRCVEGVRQLLMSAPEKPAEISDLFVDGLRQAACPGDGIIDFGRMKFSGGEKVQVTGGSFLNHLGVYEGMRARDRVSVLVKLLGRSTRVFVREDNLVAA